MGSYSGRDPERVTGRRNLLIIGGALAVMAGWRAISPRVLDAVSGPLEFEPIEGLDGYRRVTGGSVSSAAFDPFVGLETERAPPVPLDASFEKSLHHAAGSGVPIAEFTDYNCPYCKTLSERLAALSTRENISLSLHHLPLLGADSLDAARISLAVGQEAFHRRLMSARFRVDAAYALQLARDQGLDIAAIEAALPQQDRQIGHSKTLAGQFGIIGTPALVIGRTLVIGAVPDRQLADIIAAERSST